MNYFTKIAAVAVMFRCLDFPMSRCPDLLRFSQMEKKIFWMLFIVLGLVMDVALPLWWGLALTLPLAVFCWWVAYRSGWFS
jgi:hypothetical protein